MNSAKSVRWFALVAVFYLIQLGWWGVLIWNQAAWIRDGAYEALKLKREVAEAEWQERIPNADSAEEAWQEIAADFPEIVRQPQERAPGTLQISGSALEEMGNRLSRRRVMIITEGLLFVILAGLGLWFVISTARQENFLALQHSNFLHAVTHEFRSPLQALRLATETAQRRPDKASHYLEGMQEDLQRLDRLVDNVLAVGRLDAEAFRTTPRPFNLSEAISKTVASYKMTLSDDADRFHSDFDEGIIAEADPATLEPIVRNLCDNARKYGGNKTVMLQLRREGSFAVFRVRDFGRGFRAEERPHLFKRFWRAGDERVRSSPGTGLGLYLVSELVAAQDAKIEATSDGPDKGAEFIVSWPTAAAPLPKA